MKETSSSVELAVQEAALAAVRGVNCQCRPVSRAASTVDSGVPERRWAWFVSPQGADLDIHRIVGGDRMVATWRVWIARGGPSRDRHQGNDTTSREGFSIWSRGPADNRLARRQGSCRAEPSHVRGIGVKCRFAHATFRKRQ